MPTCHSSFKRTKKRHEIFWKYTKPSWARVVLQSWLLWELFCVQRYIGFLLNDLQTTYTKFHSSFIAFICFTAQNPTSDKWPPLRSALISWLGFLVLPLCYFVGHPWQVLPQQSSPAPRWWGNAHSNSSLCRQHLLAPPSLGSAPPDHLPDVCSRDRPTYPLRGWEAQESWNSHVDPRSQPKNTNKSQLHWLLVLLLRLKPGSFHVRLAFPHRFIQQVWKLGMERFSFSFSSMLQLKCSNKGLTTVWLWASSWGGASQQGLKWARSLCPANHPAARGARCSCSTGWTSLPLFLR